MIGPDSISPLVLRLSDLRWVIDEDNTNAISSALNLVEDRRLVVDTEGLRNCRNLSPSLPALVNFHQ